MPAQSVTVADADVLTHEAAMRSRGMHLVAKLRVADTAWRYTWDTAPPAPQPASTPPVPPPPPPAKAAENGAARDLSALTDGLIAAYQATLSGARTLEIDQRAQVVHVVAESARHASQRARNFASEAAADRLAKFHSDLPDLLGKVLGLAHDKATKWVGGQLQAALASGGLVAAYLKFTALVSGLVGGGLAILAAWSTASGKLVTQSGATLHLFVLFLWAGGTYLSKSFWKDVEAARGSAQPATQLLAQTLDPAESRFFSALAERPPRRATLKASGTAEAGFLIVAVAIGCLIAGAVIFGAFAQLATASN